MASVCPLKGPATTFPVTASHTRMVLSTKPEAICLPLGEKAMQPTPLVWILRGPKARFPVCASQTMIVQSRDPETMYLPSAENVTHQTTSVCPLNVSFCGGFDS